jgi:transposase
MSQANDLSRSLVALEQDSTLIAVIEMSQSTWLVGSLVPGVKREPLKRLDLEKLGCAPEALLALLQRWCEEARKAGHAVRRIVVGYEAGRDGFWLARWLRARGVEAYVMHAASIPVERTHRRAKSDKIDVGLLKRSLLGWLRGERGHCRMAAIPTAAEEDAKRPTRERDNLVGERTRLINRLKAALARHGIRGFSPTGRKAGAQLETLRTAEGEPLGQHILAEMRRDLARLALVEQQIGEIETQRVERMARAGAGRPDAPTDLMVRELARVHGLGLETADVLTHEVLSRKLRDDRAVARYGALTGAPDESGQRSREQGLARAGNLRVRNIMIQLAWRFRRFQPHCALVQWYNAACARLRGKKGLGKILIVALARKLLIALWRFATTGVVPRGLIVRPAA